MHPRTVLILVAVILVSALGARWAISHYSLLTTDPERALRRAVQLTITLNDQAQGFKMIRITNPDDVADALASLRVVSSRDYYGIGFERLSNTSIMFHFPNGQSHHASFGNPRRLGEHEIHPDFATKITAIVSRLEGKQVDLFQPLPPVQQPWDFDVRKGDDFDPGIVPPPGDPNNPIVGPPAPDKGK